MEDIANKELDEMRVIVEMGGDLAPYKQRIEKLYLQVCGKHLRKCKCKNVLKDAFIEIYSQLRRNKVLTTKNGNMAKAKLVMGVVVFWGGTHYTNKNLTDDVARQFLAKFPQRKDWFQILPPDEVVEVADNTPERGAEIAPEEVKSKSKPIAPKKKKTAKKRK